MIANEFDDWQNDRALPQHSGCSPNLRLILAELQRRWPGFNNLGCYGKRPIRGGMAPSSHSFGAAIDCGFPPTMYTLIRDEVAPFLVARSHELRLQAIHDYRGSRIWRAGRTPLEADACTAWWKAQRSSQATGMGQSWCNHLHLETTSDGWGDQTPIAIRWRE